MARKPNKPWKIGRPYRGTSTVRERVNNILIGTLTTLVDGYKAVRPDGNSRTERLQFDACYWLMAGHDAKQEAGEA